MMYLFVLLTVLQVFSLNEAYDFTCPSQAQWKLRSKSLCMVPRNYTCLYNVTFRVNIYRDKCNRPRILAPGYKYVFQPNLNRATCNLSRYQPFIFETDGSSDCTFLKSICNSQGQMTYENGSTTVDRTCICNTDKGYTFVRNPKNNCSCEPSTEDCSCYIGTNKENFKCHDQMKIDWSNQRRDVLNTSQLLTNSDFDNFKYNLHHLPTNKYRDEAAQWVSICLSACLVVCVMIQKIMRLGILNPILPEAIKRLQESDRSRFKELINNSKQEKRYSVRVMIVGKETVGKTCLMRRLLKESINGVQKTDGVDIVVRRCKINIKDGRWKTGKNISDDKASRYQRAIQESESRQPDDQPERQNESFNRMTQNVPSNLRDNKNVNIVDTKNTYKEQEHAYNSLSTPLDSKLDKSNTNVPGINRLHNVSRNDTEVDIEKLENTDKMKNDREDNVKGNTNIIDIKTKKTLKEHQHEPLSAVSDLMSDVQSKRFTSKQSSNHYALCGLWDFAGQKEFYATHQAFLTNSAVYLVVADMADDILKQDVKQNFAKFQTVGEYIEFWFDTIHCHQAVESGKNNLLDPPIFIVFTGTDKYEKGKSFEDRKRELQTQIDEVLGYQSRYYHLREIIWLSNKTDDNLEFEKLQLKISATAKKMENWGQLMPLKWIILEHLIETYKKDGISFINFSEMLKLAKRRDINILDKEEVLLYLRFQHTIGSIIFFDDIHDFIILNPQWLVDAFRCLVSDKIDSTLQCTQDWTKFLRTGCISESLIKALFEAKCGRKFSEQGEHLIKVMEKFDILVKIETPEYIMPCMMPNTTFKEVCQIIGVEKSNCKRTSWLCLKFSFLPPAFFNHFCAWFIKKYEENIQENELFRGICIFNVDKSRCEKLLVTMYSDTIAVQLLSISTGDKELGMECSKIREGLIKLTDAIIKKYNLNLSYELHFKCSKGRYYVDTMSYKDLIDLKEYRCEEHAEPEVHQSDMIYMPWVKKTDEGETKKKTEPDGMSAMEPDDLTTEKINYIRLCHLLKTVAEPVVREIFDREIQPNQLKKLLNKSSYKMRYLKHNNHINIREYDLLYPRVVEYSVKFKIEKYEYEILLQNPDEELKLRAEIECVVSDLYINVEGDHKVTVIEFESGSLIVVIRLKSSADENNLKKTLKTAVERGIIGSFETASTGFDFTKIGNVSATSKDFDLRLMMVLMRHLIDLNIADLDVLPREDDLTQEADLSRIKFIRKKIIQNSDRSITDEDLDNYWKHLSEAAQRLGGGAYKKKCEELKNFKPTLQHIQEYFDSENLLDNQGQTSCSTMPIKDFFPEIEVNNLLSRDAVRRIFDKQFPPLKLENEIKSREKELAAMKKDRKITQSQWDDLFPSDKESLSSSRFDIKVMIILLSSTSFKEKDVFKTIEDLQNHLFKPEHEDRAIKKAIKEINKAV